MKKLSVLFVLFMSVFFASNVFAATNLLAGKSMNVGTQLDEVLFTTNVTTNGNYTDSFILPDNHMLWYKFDTPKDITSYDYVVDTNVDYILFAFADDKGQIFYSDKLPSGIGKPVNIQGVTYIAVKTDPADSGIIREFVVYGTEDTAPSTPKNVTVSSYDKILNVTWTQNTETDLDGYNVYLDGNKVNTNIIKGTSYQITGLNNNQNYQVQVSAVDIYGKESTLSNPVTGRPTNEMTVNLVPNGTSILVQVFGGVPPYTVTWGEGLSDTFSASSYRITGLEKNTDYNITVNSTDGQTYSETINTGSYIGYLPPVLPDPVSIFQRMIDSFGTSGNIALAVITAAVALGVLIVLGIWAWRMTKRWMAKTR